MDYYVDIDGETKGPYTVAQLRSMWSAGLITSKTLHCQEGFTEWVPLKVIQSQLEPPVTPPEPARPPPPAPQRTSRGVGKAVGIGCLALVALFAFFAIIGAISGGGRSDNGAPGLETRAVVGEDVGVRTGPGSDYALDRDADGNTGDLVPGETLYVLEERGGWIRVRVTPKDVGWSGWVRKDQTAPK